ncbi:glycoside hydrolase family 92 protein [Sediminibacillus dalangtanensis]|uniref:Glycoside hydrolase family 92 protein n=1 Tax=Sediminibacillus dalangtanensis TaxID=2729421 RepID=A0ABX7VUV7_9BACI|nr:GH92 family glycosyl hydrolase [Sediminibacillus dalangtanensis]QTN00665.1 glycoside hydrolase family 92 protein [Sediminibacillus dalangtanensis]
MKRRIIFRNVSVFLILLLIMDAVSGLGINRTYAEEGEDVDFSTSFEAEDRLPDWEDAVETIDGEEKTSGVHGEIVHEGIQGDITQRVENVTVSAENPPNEVANMLIDRTSQSKWLAFEPTAWIELDFSEPEHVIKYAFTSANDAPGRDPKNWTLYGSNDKQDWTELDKQTDQEFDERYQRKLYEFSNDQAYQYYRFEITENAGEGLTQLAEIALSNGEDAPPVETTGGMKTMVGDGPNSSYTGKTNVGWSGQSALTYQGTHTAADRGYSYNKVFDVDIAVTDETKLSYYVHPQFADEDHLDYSSTYVSVDLAFTDGTYLSELGAQDQHGIELTPQAQGESKTLYANQWNFKSAEIGEVAEGKMIDRILVAYDNPEGPGVFKGSIDDIHIKGNPEEPVYDSPVDYVNILRGTNSNSTFSRGNNFPAVAVPHGFNFWAPVTDAGSTSWLYTYQQANNEDNLPELEAFSLSHETSPWMGDRQTFQVMPSAAEEPSADREERALAFKHENEIAKPHYYSVQFENGIQTEMTPTNRASMLRFTFTGDSSKLIFDNVNNNGGLTLNPEEQTLSGYTDVKSGLSTGATRMFVYAEFDQDVIDSGKLTGEGRDNVAGYYAFDTSAGKTVTMKVATSLLSVDQAKKNLEQDIQPDDTFDSLQESAKQAWEDKLDIIEVEGASKDELTTLYSNMYRLFLYPNVGYENTGTTEEPKYQYASSFSDPAGDNTATETGAKIVNGKVYVNNGFWDTYRTSWPAYSLLTPTQAGEMIDGFVQQYKDGGWISRWSSPGYANLMVGTSSDVAFADAYLKGVTNFDVDAFYESAIKNAAVRSDDDSVGRKGLASSIFDRYTNTATGEGMSWAMDGYINDYAIANIADKLAEETGEKKYETDAAYYKERAGNYEEMFNQDAGFFMGRNPSGEWRTDAESFNPAEWGGDYTETNAWNMAFHVPQDGQGLANLYGGRAGLAEKLDEFFTTPETAEHPGHYGGLIHEMREARDVRMGMYGHSNQPAHHIPYMYNYSGQPDKTQEKIREILSRLYLGSEIGQGYPGDEDNGEMSAWYLFSAAGFYPLQMGSPEYAVGAPYFEKMTIHLENDKDIVINAPDVSDKNKYVQSLKVNGKPYEQLTIDHETIADGAVLDFEMGDSPSDWGTGEEALPDSITDSKTDGSELSVDSLHDLTDDDEGTTYHSDQGTADKLFDNTSTTDLTLKSEEPWVQYNFADGAKHALMYTVTSSSDQPQDPEKWTLIGSNDGKNWTVLDRREDERFQWRNFTRPFSIENPGNYQFYRLIIKDNGGADETVIGELELLGYRDTGAKFADAAKEVSDFAAAGDIEEKLEKQLQKKLDQSRSQFDKYHMKQSLKKLDDFINKVNKKSSDISKEAQQQLKADANVLKETISNFVGSEPASGKGKWKYRGEVEQTPIFEFDNLKANSVEPEEDATVSVEVKNIGLMEGERQIDLSFDGELLESKTVNLAPDETETVNFTIPSVPAGIHKVEVNGLSADLHVLYAGQAVLDLGFDEDNIDSIADGSPYGHDVSVSGNASFTEGKFGQALRLDGGWAEIPHSVLLNGGDRLSISFWVKLDDAGNDQKIIGKTSIGDGFVVGVEEGIYPELWTETGRLSMKEGSVPSQEWTHLVLTWEQGEELVAYMNGEKVAESTAGSSPITDNEKELIIGGAPWNPSALQMKGSIDEVKMFKEVLSEEEVEQLYQNNTIN